MFRKKKESDAEKLIIPGCLLLGLGAGMLLTFKNPMAIPACTLIGLGIGMVISYIVKKKR